MTKIVLLHGGLGNQLFQFFLYKKLKKNHSRVYLSKSLINLNPAHYGYELDKLIKIDEISLTTRKSLFIVYIFLLNSLFIKLNLLKIINPILNRFFY